MNKILICLFLGLALSTRGQEAAPPEPKAVARVRAELEAMMETDQSLRQELIKLEKQHGPNSPEVQAAWAKQAPIDAQNIRRLDELIAQQGWPGRTQYGDQAATAAFLIVQHADLDHQKKYLPLAREAVGKGEMPGPYLALLEDRVRIRDGQKQLYGSQVNRNSADEWEPLPLEDEAQVDTRRASVGLQPLAEYLKGFAERNGGRVSPKWLKATTPEPTEAPAAKPPTP